MIRKQFYDISNDGTIYLTVDDVTKLPDPNYLPLDTMAFYAKETGGYKYYVIHVNSDGSKSWK